MMEAIGPWLTKLFATIHKMQMKQFQLKERRYKSGKYFTN